MALTIADQYYLKALDWYGYDMEQVVENLNYALGYEHEHAGANCLMGRLYMEYMNNLRMAEEYFVAALSAEPDHLETCERYVQLMIRMGKLDEAMKLIRYSRKLSGSDLATLFRMEALIHEMNKAYDRSKECLIRAISESLNSEFISFLKEEISRVERKEGAMHSTRYVVN